MKKFNILAVATLFVTLAFTSCSETPVTDDEVILETQAIDKEDSTTQTAMVKKMIQARESIFYLFCLLFSLFSFEFFPNFSEDHYML